MNPASVFVLLLFTINIYTIDADDNPTYYHSDSSTKLIPSELERQQRSLISTIGLVETSYTCSEDCLKIDIVIGRSGCITNETSIFLSTLEGTAQGHTDYEPATFVEITFSEDATEYIYSLWIIDNFVVENTESFTIEISLPSISDGVQLGDITSADINIIDDDIVIYNMELYFCTCAHYNEGSRLTLKIRKSGYNDVPVSVDFITQNGTAHGGQDFFEYHQTLTYLSDTREQTIQMQYIDDDVVENTEIFVFYISVPVGEIGYTEGQNNVEMNIRDTDKLTISFGTDTYTIMENEAALSVTLYVTAGRTEIETWIYLRAQDGTASYYLDGADFNYVYDSVYFGPGDTEMTHTVYINDDGVREEDEYFRLYLSASSSGSTTVGTISSANVTILDNQYITVNWSLLHLETSENGSLQLTLIVYGVTSYEANLSISVHSPNGQVVADVYLDEPNITIPAYQTFVTGYTVSIISDNILEDDEDILLMITGYDRVIGGANATITILNDDDVRIGLMSSNITAYESNRDVNVTLQINGEAQREVFVFLVKEDGTATGLNDFSPEQQVVVFDAGINEVNVTVPITNDDTLEDIEFFYLRLSVPDEMAGIVLLDQDIAKVDIEDDDSVVVGFQSKSYNISENDGVVTVTIVKTGTSDISSTVFLIITSDTATGSDDFIPIQSLIEFLPEQLELNLTINIVNDQVQEELYEVFYLELDASNSSNIIVEQSMSSVSIYIQDDDFVTIYWEMSTYTVIEAVGLLTLTALMDGLTSIDIPITVNIANETNGGSVGSFTAQLIVFTSNTSHQEITITIIDDDILEANKNITFYMSNPTILNRVVIDEGNTTVVIIDDDYVMVCFVISNYSIVEDIGPLNITLKLYGDADIDVTVYLHKHDGTATGNNDFMAAVQDVLFQAGVKEVTVPIVIINDLVLESIESFHLQVTVPVDMAGVVHLNDTKSFASVTIIDTDFVTVNFTSSVYTVNESSGQVTLSLMKIGASDIIISVYITVYPDTAIAFSDYNIMLQSHEVYFHPNEHQKLFTIHLIDDQIRESSERFLVELSQSNSTYGVILEQNETSVIIIDEDTVVLLWELTDYTVFESCDTVNITILKQGESADTIIANVAIVYETAKESEDVGNFSEETIVFLPNSTSETISVTIIDDNRLEEREEFVMVLSVSTEQERVIVGRENITVAIIDDDIGTVSFVSSKYMEEEGRVVDIIIQLTRVAFNVNITVLLTTEELTATASSDFDEISRIITFTPDIDEVIVPLNLLEDSILESTESLLVQLQVPNEASGTVLRIDKAVIDILDNDNITVSLSSDKINVTESTNYVNITYEHYGLISEPVIVIFTAFAGSATGGSDFVGNTTESAFTTSETIHYILIPIINDDVRETDEYFTVEISLPRNSTGVLLDQHVTLVHIIDDDRVTIAWEHSSYTVQERDGMVHLRALMYGATDLDVSVSVTTSDGTALAPLDYVNFSSNLHFDSLINSSDISIEIEDNEIVEYVKTFIVKLTIEDNQERIGVVTSETTIYIINDDIVIIRFSPQSYIVAEDDESVNVTLQLVGEATRPLSVLVNSIGISSTDDIDYIPIHEEVLFSPNVVGVHVTLSIVDDNILEMNESIELNLAVPQGLHDVVSIFPETAVVTITDNDGIIFTFTYQNWTVTESEGIIFIAVRSEGESQTTSTVLVSTTGITAADDDYMLLINELTFDSSSTQNISIKINHDGIREKQEEFIVQLHLPEHSTGLVIQHDIATVKIIDEDYTTISWNSSAYTTSESNGVVHLSVIKEGMTAIPIYLSVAILSSSASGGDDFTLLTQEISFVNESEQFVSLLIDDDNKLEELEEVRLTLEVIGDDTRVSLQESTTTLFIVDDDRVSVRWEYATYTVSEQDETVVLSLVLIGTLSTNVTVQVATRDGTARVMSDYESTRQLVTFTTLNNVQDLSVPIINDGSVEFDETFIVEVLSSDEEDWLDINSTTTTVFITNDDIASIQILSASFSEDRDGDLIIKAFVEKNTSSVHDITVIVTVKNGSKDNDDGEYLNVYPKEFIIPPTINQLNLLLNFAYLKESSAQTLPVVTIELILPSTQPDITVGEQTTVQIELKPVTDSCSNDDDETPEKCSIILISVMIPFFLIWICMLFTCYFCFRHIHGNKRQDPATIYNEQTIHSNDRK